MQTKRPAYPVSRRDSFTERIHEVLITDPYRWLEQGESPEVRAWTDSQNSLTDSVLGSAPQTGYFADQLRLAFGGDTVLHPVARGTRLFYLRRSSGRNQPVLTVRETPEGPDRVILDPNMRNQQGTTALDWWEPSPDGSLIAFGLSENGDEWSTLSILDVATGSVLADEIPRTRYSSIAWEPDGTGFFYTRYPLRGEVPAGQENYNRKLFYHVIGQSYRDDALIFGTGRSPQEMVHAKLSGDGRYLLLEAAHGWNNNDVYLLDRQVPGASFVPVVEGEDALFYGEMADGTLYLLTNWSAPHYRILAVNLADPAPEHWRELLPESPDLILQSFTLAGDKIVVHGARDAVSCVLLLDRQTSGLTEASLPPLGSISSMAGEAGRPEAFLVWESFTAPPAIYRLRVTDGAVEPLVAGDTPVSHDAMTVRQIFYTSKDGTQVPMFILHRADAVLNGDLPTVLTGYGGFNISRSPAFSPAIYPWLEQGGVYAIACLRGGSEYGETWHRDGMLGRKQNVFDDFIAAAEYLTQAGYTRPERLGIFGRSNGGLLVGTALTQRPDLFRAVVCGVPLLDMLRYHKFLIGGLWVTEYGSANDPEQFGWLYDYSPYHHVQEGTAYPATYFFAAASDTRVDPLHARKMAALLQYASASDWPVLLRIEFGAGHGVGKPVAKVVMEQAEVFGFLAGQLGLQVK